MNHPGRIVCALVAVSLAQTACLGTATQTQASASTPAPVRVAYAHPEKFTDFGDRYLTADESRRVYQSELQRYIVRQAAPLLKQREQLVITIADIDMAGSFEPGRRHERTDASSATSIRRASISRSS